MKFFSSSAFGGQLRLFYLSILYVIFYLKVGLVYLATANLRRKLILKMRSHEGNLEVSDVGCVRAIAAFVLNKLITTVRRVRNVWRRVVSVDSWAKIFRKRRSIFKRDFLIKHLRYQ